MVSGFTTISGWNISHYSFNDVSVVNTPYTPLIPPTLCEEIYSEERAFYFDVTENTTSEIPRSVELVKTVPKSCENDYLHPTIAASKNLMCDIYNQDPDNHTFGEVKRNKNTDINSSKDINWDDMLDFELLTDECDLENKNTDINKTISTMCHHENNIVFQNNNLDNATKDKGNKGQKRKSKMNTQLKTKVRKDLSAEENKIMPIESTKTPNNLKSNNKPKNQFRKQKYTKTVKNWLDNVEPHPVEDDSDNIVNIVNSCSNEKNKLTENDELEVNQTDEKVHCNKGPELVKKKIVIDKTQKTAKKVVQAQLANKGGVMKFSKPTTDIEEPKNVTVTKESKPKDNKEKNVKKFVAPIKSQIPVKDVTFEICTLNDNNIENYEDKLNEIKNHEILAVLIYSNGFCQLNSHHTEGTCTPDGVIININDVFYCFKSAHQTLKSTLKTILENNQVVCYGAQSLLICLATYFGTELKFTNMYDAKIGACLLDPDNPPENFTDVQKLLSYTAPYTIATECELQKCAWYMTLLKECWAKLYDMLVEESLWKVFVEIEMKLLPIIAGMKKRGITIDLTILKSMEELLLSRMKLVEQQCYKAAGKVFQINSAVQVRAILYDELQLDTRCNVKIRETICKGAKSTSETMLRSLVSEHPLPKLILEYRHLHKAHATFLAGIAQHVKDGVVRPTWVQTAAATGRIASNNPNLQAIPKAPFSLVMFPDAADNDPQQLVFRSVYISRQGQSFLAADFKHVECRVFAHAAADAGLLHALTASHDLFKVLAAQWLKKPEEDVVPEERERTKRLVYASLYGAGTRKLMEILDVDYQQALQVAASFNRTFPSLKSFGRGVVSRCCESRGRLASLCGRVRRFSNIDNKHFALKSHAERQAVNFIVQGSAADLCKIAMILTEERLRSSVPAVDAHLVLQIHDELVWEVKDQDVDRAAGIIKEVMESCGRYCGMPVTLPVAISVGKNWGHMEEYTEQ